MTKCLKPWLFLSLVSFVSSLSLASSEASFKAYVNEYSTPELIQDNNLALSARFKLLDMAPAGSIVKIATFTLDNGKVARALALHTCEATKKGVKVQLLVDSKSGDVLGRKNPFNASPDAQMAEQIMQFMANCGVQVYVHNSFSDFVEFEGTRFPNIFNQAMHDGMSGQTVGLPNFGGRLIEITNVVSDLSDEALSEQGAYGAGTSPFLVNLLHLGADFIGLKNDSGAPAGIAKLADEYKNFILDPVWNRVKPEKALAALPTILRHFQEYPDVRDVYAQSRRFNRLNHKKMFEVRLPTGEGCLIIGGRNLGDKYLISSPGDSSYLDGDILICNQHSRDILKSAENSFNGLLKDEVDPMLDPALFGSGSDSPAINHVRLIQKRSDVDLSSLEDLRTLKLASYPDETAVHGDAKIPNGKNWKILVANWSTDQRADQVQQALLNNIKNEQREIFIETAYAEFGQNLRSAFEKALARGVHVKIITNSFAETDGKSKVIRVLMAPWENRIKVQYPNLFDLSVSTARGGHMTHLKAAGFRCQAGGSGYHKSFIVGSHNFHPRSGRSDKEHSIYWEEEALSNCKEASSLNSSDDLIGKRELYYQSLVSRSSSAGVLTIFHSLFDELRAAVSGQNLDPQAIFTAKVIKEIIYQPDGKLKDEAKTEQILNALEDSGLRDLIGSEF